MSQTQGAVRVPAASSFALSWEGLEAPSNYKEAFDISITDRSATLSCSAGSSAYGIYFVSSAPYFSDYSDPKKIVGASGSETVTSSVSLNGKTLCLNYTGTFAGWNTFYITFYDPVTLTAPSNFKASQSGQTVNLSWTGSSASGGSGSIVYKLYNVSDGTVVTSTTATSLSIAASTLGYASCQYKIIAEYDGHTQNSASIYFEPKAPSLSTPAKPTVTISGNKFTVSWSAASGAYGTGNVTYVLHYGNKATGYFESSFDVGTARTYTIEFTDWSMQHGFTVTAYYSGVEATGETTYITTPTPTLTKPGAPQVSQTGRKVTVTWAAAKGSNGVGDVYYYLFAGSEDSVVYQGAGTSAVITAACHYVKEKVISSLRRIAVQNSGVRRLILQRTVHSSRHQALHQFRILMEFLLCLGKQPSARMAMERSLTPFSMGMLQTDLARSQSQLAQRRLRPLRCG